MRLFIEVGPNSILSSLTKNILHDKPVTILSSNFKNSDDMESLQKLYAALFVEGMKLNPAAPIKDSSNITKQEISSEKEISYKTNNLMDVSVVYSGVSIGLPGSYKDMFRDDNFDQVFEGRNFIERLTDEERQRMVDLRISKLVKNERGATFQLLSSLEDVIQLAGKAGKKKLVMA